MKNANLVVGQIVTCQMGNPSDTYGFRRNVSVEVIGVQERCFANVYLFREVADHTFVGEALVPVEDSPVEDELYCTMAFKIGGYPFKTEEAAVKYMGFNL